MSEVKKLISAEKTGGGGGVVFHPDQFPDPSYLSGLHVVEVAQLRGLRYSRVGMQEEGKVKSLLCLKEIVHLH